MFFQGTDAYIAKVGGYNIDVELWSRNLPEIMRHFTPRYAIASSVDNFLHQAASALHAKDDLRDLLVRVLCLMH